mmetsp:Transcript_17679/g.46409  ORF Transcript_17679/g.46409 Transcript_17679/m.46409 type:complete len:358 (-) Transcript_17679:116-1189(-)
MGRRLDDRHRVAHARVVDGLDRGHEVPDLARLEGPVRHGDALGHHDADLRDVVRLARGQELDLVALGDAGPVDHPKIRDHALVRVELRVEDEAPRRLLLVVARRRHALDDRVQHVADAQPALRGGQDRVRAVQADRRLDLLGDALRLRRGQVDLVEDGDDLEVVLERQVDVRERLGLDALGRVDDQQRALAGGERPRHLVAEVDVAGRVDQVEHVGLAVLLVGHARRVQLDRDAPLPLQVHGVQELGLHVARGDRGRRLEHAVGQRGLAVVDVGDDREVADVRGRRLGLEVDGAQSGEGPARGGRRERRRGGEEQRCCDASSSFHAATPLQCHVRLSSATYVLGARATSEGSLTLCC